MRVTVYCKIDLKGHIHFISHPSHIKVTAKRSIIVQSPKFTRTILLKPMHNTSTTYIQQYLSSKDLDICQTNNRSGQNQMSLNVKSGSFLSTEVENNKVAFSSIHDQ